VRNTLASQIGIEAATIVFGAVLTYAVYRAAKGGGIESAETLLQSSWTAGSLGALIYTLLLIRLRRRIVRPIREIRSHTEDMSFGVFQKWDYAESCHEIDHVTAMMNLVASYNNRIQNSWRALSFDIAPSLIHLLQRGDLPQQLRSDLEATWNHLRRMDVAIMRVLSPSPHFSEPWVLPMDQSVQHSVERSHPQPQSPFRHVPEPSDLLLSEIASRKDETLPTATTVPEACA